jgi:hypothetical protein
MESPEGVAAKRRVLVDALTMCLQRSKVCEVVDAQTVRSVIESASTELWREGEFRLEYVWKILCQQPGLTAKEVAPPLLVFKAYETELGVNVRVPQALSALPRGEQVRLRDELGITKADFAKAIGELQALALAERARSEAAAPSAEMRRQESAKQQAATKEKAAKADKPDSAGTRPVKPERKRLAMALSGLAALALALGVFLGLRNTVSTVSLPEVAPLLQLADAVRDGSSLTARIADPKWDSLPKDARIRLAGQVFDVLAPKGIKTMTLVDANRHQKALVSDASTPRLIVVSP